MRLTKSERIDEHCRDCSDERELCLELYWMLKLQPWHTPITMAQEPPGLSPAKREAFWTAALEQAVSEALAE